MKTWIWNGTAVAMLAALAFAFGGEGRRPVAPYRYPLTQRIEADDEVVALEERIARSPEGLDLAALSRAYLKQARQTGKRRWIDQAEAAARRSLEALPVSNGGAFLRSPTRRR